MSSPCVTHTSRGQLCVLLGARSLSAATNSIELGSDLGPRLGSGGWGGRSHSRLSVCASGDSQLACAARSPPDHEAEEGKALLVAAVPSRRWPRPAQSGQKSRGRGQAAGRSAWTHKRFVTIEVMAAGQTVLGVARPGGAASSAGDGADLQLGSSGRAPPGTSRCLSEIGTGLREWWRGDAVRDRGRLEPVRRFELPQDM
jgi:hypothetical protein